MFDDSQFQHKSSKKSAEKTEKEAGTEAKIEKPEKEEHPF